MSQDKANNEAASARLLRAVKVYAFNYLQDEADDVEVCVCGPKQQAEAKEVFAAIAAAEATSSPVPRVGGPDEAKSGLFADFMAEAAKAGITKLDFSDLAHVARQEPAADTGAVDVAELDRLAAHFIACVQREQVAAGQAAWSKIVTHINARCAQQREAGRQEKRAEFEALQRAHIMVVEQCAEMIQAAFARQPVSAELTSQQVADLVLTNREIVTELGHRALLNGDAVYANLPFLTRLVNAAFAAFAAVPPAKAEGMSDTKRIEHLEAWLREGKASGFHWNTFAFDTEKTVRAQLDTSRETFAQQAKGASDAN